MLLGSLALGALLAAHAAVAGAQAAPDRVILTEPGTDAAGDVLQGNMKAKSVTLTGNVVMHRTKAGGSLGKLAEKPSTITTDELTVDWGNKRYTAVGNVHFVQGDRTMTAERGVLNDAAHQLDLSGHVVIVQGEKSSQAQTVHYNTESEAVKMDGGVMVRFPAETPGPAAAPAPSGSPGPAKKKRGIF